MEKTHWKRLHNPDYMGVYSMDEGKSKILTIKEVKLESVFNAQSSKKEDCVVCYWIEDEKPMILNSGNSKAIEKMYGTPYIEDWKNKKVELIVKKEKIFGQLEDCLRIKPQIPVTTSVKCEICGATVKPEGAFSVAQILQQTQEKYGQNMCVSCAKEAKDAASNRK